MFVDKAGHDLKRRFTPDSHSATSPFRRTLHFLCSCKECARLGETVASARSGLTSSRGFCERYCCGRGAFFLLHTACGRAPSQRLVESMSAWLCGVGLRGGMLALAQAKHPPTRPAGRRCEP